MDVTTRFTTVDPSTEQVLAEYHSCTASDIDEVLDRACAAQREWGARGFDARAEALRDVARSLRAEAPRYARLITQEMGKPIGEAEAEIEKSAWGCEFYAENAEEMLAGEIIESTAAQSYTVHEPIGVVLGVMPWNFPFWQVIRFAAPALMAGNAVVLKHAPNVTGCALALRMLFRALDIPEGLFEILVVAPSDVSHVVPAVIADRRVAAVTFTGSDRAGSEVGAAAGRAIKKSVLELGGSDPFIVLSDANLTEAAKGAVTARFLNAGQSCASPKRLIVDRSVLEGFVALLVDAVREIAVGDPLETSTRLGPLARADLRDAVERQVEAAVGEGARILLGGGRLDRRGFFYAPTVVTDVNERMTVAQEEVFGPVAVILAAKDERDAIELANATSYGLAASIWTNDLERAERRVREIECGCVFVNGIVASDPRLPFGGTKRSGYGRELGAAGLREFTNLRTVWVGPAQR